MIYAGTMRSASGVWADPTAERRLAHQMFGTPLDTRTQFSEPHGFWWAILEEIWPAANFLHVWVAAT